MNNSVRKLKAWLVLFSILGSLLASSVSFAGWIPIQSELAKAQVAFSVLQFDLKQVEREYAKARSTKRDNQLKRLKKSLQSAEKYQEALELLSEKGFPLVHTNASGEKTLHSQLKERLKKAIADLDQFLDADIPALYTLKLLEHIESNRNNWHFPLEVPSAKLIGMKGRGVLQFNVRFLMDEEDRLYIEYGESLLGTGKHKEVYRLVRYDDWMPLALPRLKAAHEFDSVDDFDVAQRDFEKEKRFLKRLNTEPSLHGVGVVKTHHVGNHLFLEKMDRELYDIVSGNFPIRLSLDDRLKFAKKLAYSLASLQRLGICMSDLKPENILISISDEDEPRIEDIVLADFGMGFEPEKLFEQERNKFNLKLEKFEKEKEEFEKSGRQFTKAPPKFKSPVRPMGGSPHYAAPELSLGPEGGENGWYGRNDAEKIRNAYKADVFSLAVVLYSFFHFDDGSEYNHAPWFWDRYTAEYEQKSQWGWFFERRGDLIRYFIDDLLNTQSRGILRSIDHLLAEALQPDPYGRISLEHFHERLVSISEENQPAVPDERAEAIRGLTTPVTPREAGRQDLSQSSSAPVLQPSSTQSESLGKKILRFLHLI